MDDMTEAEKRMVQLEHEVDLLRAELCRRLIENDELRAEVERLRAELRMWQTWVFTYFDYKGISTASVPLASIARVSDVSSLHIFQSMNREGTDVTVCVVPGSLKEGE